jgi:hypothetical protein
MRTAPVARPINRLLVLEHVCGILCTVSLFFLGIPALLAVPVCLATWLLAERTLDRIEAGEMGRDRRPAAVQVRRAALAYLWLSIAGAGIWLVAYQIAIR